MVSLGGPFKDVFCEEEMSGADVCVCLLSDETDIDSKQMVAIKTNSKVRTKL